MKTEWSGSRLTEVDSPFVGVFRRKIDMSISTRAYRFHARVRVYCTCTHAHAITLRQDIPAGNLANKYLVDGMDVYGVAFCVGSAPGAGGRDVHTLGSRHGFTLALTTACQNNVSPPPLPMQKFTLRYLVRNAHIPGLIDVCTFATT